MVDTTHLDHVRTFLGKVHTAATVKHFTEQRALEEIDDTSRMLVYPPEIVGYDASYYFVTERFKIKVFESSEANMLTALNNIAIGVNKLNTRQTITSYTRPAAFVHAEIVNSNKPFINSENYFWIDLIMDCEFTTS